MRRRRRVGFLAVLLTATAVAGRADAASPSVLYRFADARITEASGLAPGVRSPGVDWVQNDSGDSARVFAVDTATGRTAAVLSVTGATNVDWEDLAVAPGPQGSASAGRSSLWIADVGDNTAARAEVRVYRVDEPAVPAGARDLALRSAPADVWRLRYPDGPHDAESLAVTPQGTGYVITKSVVGASGVYRLPPRPDPVHVQTLVRVGQVTFHAHPTDQPLGEVGTLTATGAALSRDGTLLAVRTYADAWLWRVTGGDIAAAVRSAPTRVPLPVQPQGEGVAVAKGRLLVDSEGRGSAVYAVPLPAERLTPDALASSLAYGSLPLTFRATAPARDTGSVAPWLWAGAVLAAGIAAGGIAVRTRRRRAR